MATLESPRTENSRLDRVNRTQPERYNEHH
jgi:hypothetical protein